MLTGEKANAMDETRNVIRRYVFMDVVVMKTQLRWKSYTSTDSTGRRTNLPWMV
jgi:hypothetical protein